MINDLVLGATGVVATGAEIWAISWLMNDPNSPVWKPLSDIIPAGNASLAVMGGIPTALNLAIVSNAFKTNKYIPPAFGYGGLVLVAGLSALLLFGPRPGP